jgi:hypothetical protein
MPADAPSSARRLIDSVPVWDHHACLPLRPGDASFLPQLARHKAAGFDAVTVNIGFGEQGPEAHLRMIAALRHWLQARPHEYLLLLRPEDVERARASAPGRGLRHRGCQRGGRPGEPRPALLRPGRALDAAGLQRLQPRGRRLPGRGRRADALRPCRGGGDGAGGHAGLPQPHRPPHGARGAGHRHAPRHLLPQQLRSPASAPARPPEAWWASTA